MASAKDHLEVFAGCFHDTDNARDRPAARAVSFSRLHLYRRHNSPPAFTAAFQCPPFANDAVGETRCRRDGRDLFREPVIALEATSEGVPQDDGPL